MDDLFVTIKWRLTKGKINKLFKKFFVGGLLHLFLTPSLDPKSVNLSSMKSQLEFVVKY